MLPTRILGRTGLRVTEIALGGAGFGASRADQLYGGVSNKQAEETIHAALSRGINYIDTAPQYAESERRLGHVLADLQSDNAPLPILSTKVGDECPPYSDNGGHDAMSYDGILHSFEHSLNTLHVDKVDILLLHDPTFKELQQFLAPGGGMDALTRLKREGCIGHIGLGCVELENHAAVLDDGRVEVILTVNDCNLVRRYVLEDIYPTAQSQDVGIVNAGIFYMGLLGGLRPEVSYSMGFKQYLRKHELVRLANDIYDFCQERGTSIRKAALEFSLSKFPGVSTVPVGCRTAEEVHGLVDAYEAPKLDEAFWSEFDALFEERVASFDIKEHWFYNKADSQVL